MHSVGTPVLWAIFTVVIAIMLRIDILYRVSIREEK